MPTFLSAEDALKQGIHVDRIIFRATLERSQLFGGERLMKEPFHWGFEHDIHPEYETNVLIGTTASILLSGSTILANVFSSFDSLGYVYYELPSGKLTHGKLSLAEELTQGPPKTSWTIPSVFVTDPSPFGAVKELAALVTSIQTLQLPQRSPSIMGLARRAAQAQGHAPRNVQEWARRLADEVGGVND
jgi:hypothetical protein